MVGLAWVERVCGGGATAGVSSSELKRGGGGVLRCGSTEKAKGGEELLAGVEVVLMRARDEALGCCSGRSTAALRWRPRGRLCARRGRVARPGRL